MKFHIKSTKFKLTPPLKTYIEIKLLRLEKLLKKFEANQNLLIRIEVARTSMHHKKGNVYRAEANLDIGKRVLRAESENWDIRLAINEVYRELEREIVKFKGKLFQKRSKP